MKHIFLPNLKTWSDAIAPAVLVVGDPARATQAAERLEGSMQVSRFRDYHVYSGRFDGVPVTVASHGVGSAGATVCFEELARAGVRTIVRAGTCGGLQPEVQAGDIVVATGAVREDGVSPRLVPLAFPAIADTALMAALERAAEQAGVEVRRGIVCTHDVFYPSPLFGPTWEVWHKSGVVAIEMELAPLLIVAALHRIRAAGIFVADGNVLTAARDMSDYRPEQEKVEQAKERMLDIALQALAEAPQESAVAKEGN